MIEWIENIRFYIHTQPWMGGFFFILALCVGLVVIWDQRCKEVKLLKEIIKDMNLFIGDQNKKLKYLRENRK